MVMTYAMSSMRFSTFEPELDLQDTLRCVALRGAEVEDFVKISLFLQLG